MLGELPRAHDHACGECGNVRPPPPCESCGTFRAACEAPVGDGARWLCWVCAHHVVMHGAEVGQTISAECECTPDEIYPADVRSVMLQEEPVEPAPRWRSRGA
jgi:hypothetical protein